MGYEHIRLDVADHIGWLWLDRAEKLNAMSADMWADIPSAMAELNADEAVRVIIVAGRGRSFTVGIDLAMLAGFDQEADSEADRRTKLYRKVKQLQTTMSVFAESPKPVIAAVHGHCLGAGIDLISACDMRIASADAVFSVRETRMGLVADVGTMQRLPNLIPPGHLAELVYTGRDIDATEAERIGLTNRTLPDVESLIDHARELAASIAANSPLVVQGAKQVLRAQADMSTAEALDHAALWSASFLWSNDLQEAMAAFVEKRDPDFTGT